jgi:cysteine desulfurase
MSSPFMIYLDYNATAPMKPAVRAAMMEAMERHGNPSSVHRYGRIARRYVEEARAAVAALVGVKPAQVIFTGSGTEANNMVFRNPANSNVIISAIEHDSVRACAPGATLIPANENGAVDLVAAQKIIKSAPADSLISVMLVNNETGVVQPVSEIVRMTKEHGHRVHTDAVQAAGRLPIDFNSLGVDYLTLSAHKIGGPQGIGALIVREGASIAPMIKGGGQEMNRRAGTENTAAIVGFGIAARLAADDLRDVPRLSLWRDDLQKHLQEIAGKDAVIIGDAAPRVANTLCIALRGMSNETQVMAMDLAGVAVSAGSACTSGKVKASHVLGAIGFGKEISASAIRISLGWNTKQEDITRCVDAWRALYQRRQNASQSEAA